MKSFPFLRFIALFIFFTGPAQAEDRYVTDELTITVRSGQDSGYRVLESLPSGTQVEVLSENSDTGYSRVRTPEGTEGYALTRYLQTEEPAQVELARAKDELEQLRAQTENDTVKELNELKSEYQSLKLQYDTLEFENVQLTQQLDAVKDNASNVVSLMDEREEALQRANRLATELDELQVRNRELENHTDKKWFMAGAGVLILGIIVGIILPKVGTRRRGRWGGSGDFNF
ncbi:MAG: TIGR04211 family SH3 domain-containing protein [Gammaproteobacteria bacterium]|nr:TIGR04211 family SH3 domain-containing protein [Gammaproteobacteria bacterium]